MKVAWIGLSFVLRALTAGVAVCLICWTLVECAPGPTAERAAIASGAVVAGDVQTPPEFRTELVAEVAREFNLEGSALGRVPRRAIKAVHFDFGRSWRNGQDVAERIASRKGVTTLVLCLGALLLSVVVAGMAAPRSARHPESRPSQAFAIATALALSIPIPWVAMLALDVFAYGHPLSIAPKGGLDSFADGLLPIVVLAAVPIAVFWRHVRQEILDVSDSQWVLAARARGVDESRLWNQHLLKAALPTIFALVPLMLAYLLAAAVVVERVFAIDGLGTMVASAANEGDIPILVAFATLSATFISVATQSMNLLSKFVDPRREAQR